MVSALRVLRACAPSFAHSLRHPGGSLSLALSRVSRGKLVAGLKSAPSRQLISPGNLKPLAKEKALYAFRRPLFGNNWVLDSYRPYGRPEHLLLGTLTHIVPPSPTIGSYPSPTDRLPTFTGTITNVASTAKWRRLPNSACAAPCCMSCRAGCPQPPFRLPGQSAPEPTLTTL